MDNICLSLGVVVMCPCCAEFVNVFCFLSDTEITACWSGSCCSMLLCKFGPLIHTQDLVIKVFIII